MHKYFCWKNIRGVQKWYCYEKPYLPQIILSSLKYCWWLKLWDRLLSDFRAELKTVWVSQLFRCIFRRHDMVNSTLAPTSPMGEDKEETTIARGGRMIGISWESLSNVCTDSDNRAFICCWNEMTTSLSATIQILSQKILFVKNAKVHTN